MKSHKTKFEKDLSAVAEFFPKLAMYSDNIQKLWILKGDLDICDPEGRYWGTFNIKISIPFSYPNCVPIVREISTHIPRIADRHVNEQGICCLDVDHQLLYMAKRGINIKDFIANKVYPFFANQLYFEKMKHFANQEYAHGFDGIRQFYAESLQLSSPQLAIHVLQEVLNKKVPGRNASCICGGNNKYKACHESVVEFMLVLGKDQLLNDLNGFLSFVSSIENRPSKS